MGLLEFRPGDDLRGGITEPAASVYERVRESERLSFLPRDRDLAGQDNAGAGGEGIFKPRID